jgi:hypothetical protein
MTRQKMRPPEYVLKAIAATIIILFSFFIHTDGAFAGEQKDFSQLINFIKLNDRVAPLFPFNDFVSDPDKASHQEYVEYINSQPGLLLDIQSRLGHKKIQWKLGNLSHRLLFVPENRKPYASLYETYCHNVIDYILDKTKLENPYQAVQTLFDEKPEISENSTGVTVFLVHNIVEESLATYIFSNPAGKKVEIELSSHVFSGTVGCYSSQIYIRKDGKFEFKNNTYTIWQNSAKNPYTALMVPAEETLHIALRKYTETAIKTSLTALSKKTLTKIEGVVDEWMSVEEAIVGGLVYSLLPNLIDPYLDNQTQVWIDADLEKKESFARYKRLKKGINLVEKLGCAKSIEIYKDNPIEFKHMLDTV